MIKIELYGGISIEDAVKKLQEEAAKRNDVCCAEFNLHEIYSTDTIDEAYKKITGVTKAEYEDKEKKWHEDYKRKEAEHKAKIPQLTDEYRKKARGLVIENELEFWDKIVPIRLGDLYHGMELEEVLTYCEIMRNEQLPYDERLHKCYEHFMNSGHSGMSAGLTSSMIKKFCPHGEDLADAVMNFRFG